MRIFNFSYSIQDEIVIREMAKAVKLAASAMGIQLVSRNGRPEVCLMPAGTNHDAGTCRMGDDPSVSATDRFGQVHGVSGLYVADNSVLPSIGAANPTFVNNKTHYQEKKSLNKPPHTT